MQRNLIRTASGETRKNPRSWGIDRLDQRNLPLSKSFYYTATGRYIVTAYVVDTGIQWHQGDWADRVHSGVDLVGRTDGRVDCNGHGSHVAGTIGGGQFGVARQAILIPVRVLACDGSGNDADILAGLEWITAHRTRSDVVNMSLGGSFSQALNDGVQNLIDDGITVVTAAGNGDAKGEPMDACTQSPASVPGAITVGASTSTDRTASFSNYGNCIDLYAPGVNITSDWTGPEGSFTYAVDSGTSMAAAHVTGVIVMYLQHHRDDTAAQVAAAISGMATHNKVSGVDPAFSRDLLFSLEPVVLPDGVSGGDRLLAGQSLLRGTRLYSSNGAYFLAHRARDGWLCLYQASTGQVVWSSGHSAAWTNQNSSGALSSYDSYGRRVWTTASSGGASILIVNSKGYLMIRQNSDRKVLWTSPH